MAPARPAPPRGNSWLPDHRGGTDRLRFGNGSNQEATDELAALFGPKQVFDAPKPTKRIYRIAKMATTGDDIILDFFAGSGTTAHAVWKLHADDGGARRVLLVQSEEPVNQRRPSGKLGYRTVAEIAIGRLARAAKTIPTGDAGLEVQRLMAAREFSSAA